MRLLFVADGRSPTARNWMRYWVERGDEVFLASTFPCRLDLALAGVEIIPVAFSGAWRPASPGGRAPLRRLGVGLRTRVRQWLGPLTIPAAARRLHLLAERIRPDLVHAMRIPYEGMLAGSARLDRPLVVSVWGNDFTLHARSSPLLAWHTRRALAAAGGLHTDCERDLRLARRWGFAEPRPGLVVPGNGGIRTDVFHPLSGEPPGPVVVNPRGIRAYVRNDTFFRAIPLVLASNPAARFRCPAMAGEASALDWVGRLGIGAAVELLPPLPHEQMAALFQAAQVVASPSTHDGTPNSLLEGMACGCFPVAGGIESIREWIRDGENGLLVDPGSPPALAEAILTALADAPLRASAGIQNARLIAERAEYHGCMAQAEAFYRNVIRG